MQHAIVLLAALLALQCTALQGAVALAATAAPSIQLGRMRILAQAAAAQPPPAAQPQPAQPGLETQVIRPDQAYVPAKGVLAAPNTAVAGAPLNVSQRAETIEACSELCRAAPDCGWFMYCSSMGGCLDGSGGTLPYQQCELLAEECSIPSLGLINSSEVQVTSGERALGWEDCVLTGPAVLLAGRSAAHAVCTAQHSTAHAAAHTCALLLPPPLPLHSWPCPASAGRLPARPC